MNSEQTIQNTSMPAPQGDQEQTRPVAQKPLCALKLELLEERVAPNAIWGD